MAKQVLQRLSFTAGELTPWLAGLPGITIGYGSVIGAGSVVTKDIPANSLAVGNPCKVIRQINQTKKL